MSCMIAKFKLNKVERFEHSETLEFAPVTDAKFNAVGVSEDNSFSKWTPSGSLVMNVSNPELMGKFSPGEKYYLRFEKAEA